MFKALQGTLAKLPGTTKVYCGHEYTVKNLQFGLTVEPNNTAMKQRLDEMQRLRGSNSPTVPGTIAEELATNPFMRVTEPSVLAHCKTQDPVEAMKVIRQEKDRF
ncbi:Hydroxyacylglutathione hydrolase cytoplasmic [Fasciola hepatica]|uniref:Hydroxyacylglutathione hydrolase cytoplasmic n=1 Tax=Fasciola hepatica TaxID=6192 RepID=A0A4E0RBK5_FASHE|nr:Hydroxyacylglutathione hydrolase cytoplasmic [Fasciola hepatica]